MTPHRRRAAAGALALLLAGTAWAQSTVLERYVGSVRSTINANRRYPTGRDAQTTCPEGEARVHFTLARNGMLRTSGIEQSSGSPILDAAALATIRRTTFPTPPPDAWEGPEHTFMIELAFRDAACIPRDQKALEPLTPQPSAAP